MFILHSFVHFKLIHSVGKNLRSDNVADAKFRYHGSVIILCRNEKKRTLRFLQQIIWMTKKNADWTLEFNKDYVRSVEVHKSLYMGITELSSGNSAN